MSGSIRTVVVGLAGVVLVAALAGGVRGSEVGGAQGAMEIPFNMPKDGHVSVGIYTPEGRLVRAMAQVLDVPAGSHTMRWDGLDLWGNVVPAGTDLVVKVFTNPGIRAKYEFSAASANRIPWPTRPIGEGEAPGCRRAGWR